MSRILFLGCAGTIEALYKNPLSSAAIMIGVDDVQLIINPGPGTAYNAGREKCDLAATDAVLLSSKDLIHMSDLDVIEEIVKHYSPFKEFKKILEHSEHKHNIKGVEISSIKTKTNETAFLIHTTKFILGYIPKFEYTKKFGEEFRDANILVIDCNDEFDKKNMIELIEDVDPELVILSGFGMKMIKEDPLDFSRTLKKELQKNKQSPITTQIMPAKDGMQLNTEHYNIKVKQKSLKGFV